MGGIGESIKRVVIGVLVGLMVLSFAVWGMEDVFSGGNANAVVTLGEEPIEGEAFRSAFRNAVNEANRSQPEGLTNQEAYDLGIHEQVLAQLVTETVIDIDARDLGIGVDNRLAREAVEDMEVFQNAITGELDLEELDRRLRGVGITRAQFESDIQDQLRRAQTVPAIVDGIEVPSAFAEQRFRFLSEQRAVDLLTLDADTVETPPAPTEAELSEWIESNSRLYTAPEYRRFVLLRVEPFDFAPDIEVAEDEVQDYYEYRLALSPGSTGAIAAPETRDLVQIRARDEEEAKALAARLAAGEDPELVAASVGAEAPVTLDDAVQRDVLDPNVGAVAFELAEGDAGAVLGSLPFWYAVHVVEVTPAVRPALETVRDELEAELLEELAQDALFDLVTAIEDMMDEGATLEDVAEELDLVLATYDFLDRTGTTRDGLRMSGFARIPGVAGDDAILREVFVNDIGFETDLFETATNGYAALRVLDVEEARLREMDDIREKAVEDFTRDRVDTALQALSVDLAARATAGESLEALAGDVGGEVERQILVRTARNPEVGDPVAAGLFDASEGEIVRGQGPVALSRQVARLARIQGTGDRLTGGFRDTLTDGARGEIAADIQDAYRQSVLAENPLVRNESRIRSVLGLDQGSQ